MWVSGSCSLVIVYGCVYTLWVLFCVLHLRMIRINGQESTSFHRCYFYNCYSGDKTLCLICWDSCGHVQLQNIKDDPHEINFQKIKSANPYITRSLYIIRLRLVYRISAYFINLMCVWILYHDWLFGKSYCHKIMIFAKWEDKVPHWDLY